MKYKDSQLGWFAVMWDCHGLEAVEKVPQDSDYTFAVLANKKRPDMPALNHWRLRAQFNPQRFYEIYLVSAEPGIDVDDIKAMFAQHPQTAADTVRRLGQCWFSNRNHTTKAVIQ